MWTMTDDELRALVRAAIAQYGGAGQPLSVVSGQGAATDNRHPITGSVLHPSHGRFTLPAGSDTDGPCLIEPSVLCNHCGYCQSYGH
jgi:hypothetical protein